MSIHKKVTVTSDFTMVNNNPRPNIQTSCDFILKNVRSSSLNYSVQETPFSQFLTIRKSLVKIRSIRSDFDPRDCSQLDTEQSSVKVPEKSTAKNPEDPIALHDHSKCQTKHKNLEKFLHKLQNEYEEVVIDVEAKYKTIRDLNEQINYLQASKNKTETALETTIKTLKDEKNNIQIKHEKVLAENKIIKREIEDQNKEI